MSPGVTGAPEKFVHWRVARANRGDAAHYKRQKKDTQGDGGRHLHQRLARESHRFVAAFRFGFRPSVNPFLCGL